MKRSCTHIWRPYADVLPSEQVIGKSSSNLRKCDSEVEEICKIRIVSNGPFGSSDFDKKGNLPLSESTFKPIHVSPSSVCSSLNSSRCSEASVSPQFLDEREDSSDCLSRPSSEGSISPTDEIRQRRTKFTADQLSELNRVFYKQTYLTLEQRYFLAKRLNLRESQVKNWFQNKRMKAKRDYIHAIDKGYLIPVENPGLPRFSRMPENYFLSYPLAVPKNFGTFNSTVATQEQSVQLTNDKSVLRSHRDKNDSNAPVDPAMRPMTSVKSSKMRR